MDQDARLSELAVNIHRQKGVYALLLGSGLSRSADIPTGWEITLDLIRQLAAPLSNGWTEQDPYDWYRKEYKEEPDYSKLLEQIAQTESERRGILENYFEPTETEQEEGKKLPTKAHQTVAKLVSQGYVRMILTTNFDRLMEDALRGEGIQHMVIDQPENINGAPPYVHEKCVVVKIHGDYKDNRIKNSPTELATYNPSMNTYLDRILDEFGLIPAGWSGEWDTALRNAILRMPNRRYSLYWLAYSEPSAEAQELIDFRRGRDIQGMGADEFFKTLLLKVESLEEGS